MKELFIEGAKKLILDLKQELEHVTSKCGSVTELLFGECISRQSIVIKFGNRWEKYLNDFAKKNGNNLDFDCPKFIRGHQIDYLVKIVSKIVSVNYDEIKCNVGLDSEKLPVTIQKILDVKKGLEEIYSENVEKKVGILHAIVWDRNDSPSSFSYYKKFEDQGVPVKFLKDYFSQIGVDFTREDWYNLKGEIQTILE